MIYKVKEAEMPNHGLLYLVNSDFLSLKIGLRLKEHPVLYYIIAFI